MARPFEKKTVLDVTALIPAAKPYAVAADLMLDGDMWQEGEGWVGEMPLDAAAIAGLVKGIVSENVLDEIVDRVVSGVVGKEPRWSIIRAEGSSGGPPAPEPEPEPEELEVELTGAPAPEDDTQQSRDAETEDINQDLVAFWDRNDIIGLLQRLVARRAVHGRAPVYIHIPPGLLDENGRITPAPRNLSEALRYIYVDDVPLAEGCVHKDKHTRMELGVVLEREANGNVTADISYLDERGRTVLRTLGTRQAAYTGDTQRLQDVPLDGVSAEAPIGVELEMNGRLFVHDRYSKPIVTRQLVDTQKAITLAVTQLMRNINLAGHRQVNYLGAEPPGTWEITTAEDPNGKPWPGGGYRRFKREAMKSGPGVQNFISGYDIFDEQGKRIMTTNPNVNVVDPVSVDHFERTYVILRGAALHQANQAHVLAADSIQSGLSRVQARSDFKTSLGPLKTAMDDTGRWLLEVVLSLAALLQNKPGLYKGHRAEFNCVLDLGPLTPEEQQEVRENVAAGLLSEEDGMAMIGVDDPTAMREKIRAERSTRRQDDTTSASAVAGAFGLLRREAAPTGGTGNGTVTGTTGGAPAAAGGGAPPAGPTGATAGA